MCTISELYHHIIKETQQSCSRASLSSSCNHGRLLIIAVNRSASQGTWQRNGAKQTQSGNSSSRITTVDKHDRWGFYLGILTIVCSVREEKGKQGSTHTETQNDLKLSGWLNIPSWSLGFLCSFDLVIKKKCEVCCYSAVLCSSFNVSWICCENNNFFITACSEINK